MQGPPRQVDAIQPNIFRFGALDETPGSKNFTIVVDPVTPPPGLEGAVVAIGNFDGVHRGHISVIARAKALAMKLGRPSAVLTFEPHPTDFFKGENTIFRLTPLETKAKLIERLGIDGLIVLSFKKDLASLTAEAFVRDILVRRLGIGAAIAGYDFHFGAKRSGSPAFLKEAGERFGFIVEIVDKVAAQSLSEPASSTATRSALEAGDVARAAQILGHPYEITGAVVAGQTRGRTLGFPTANILPDPSCRLRHGIYAVRVIAQQGIYNGVASFGRRPTFDHGQALLETFLFDFSGDLYGETIEVFFLGWIRPEEKFQSAAALIEKMKRDVAEAKRILLSTSIPLEPGFSSACSSACK